jgi:hypothetical protein
MSSSHHCMKLNYCDSVKSACLRGCRPVRVARILIFCYNYLCQINTDGDKQIYKPIDVLTRDSNSPWNMKHVLYQFHFVTHKFDVSFLKKADRGAIISQVKNWITSWVNYCENEAEYLKSFSLFTAFMDRPDVKERLGECHSSVMDTYISVTWMAKKEKLLFYNRLTTRNFDQCTSCSAEHENSSMKWGEMVVNHQKQMHQAVQTINKRSNSIFTVKEGRDAKNLEATQNWSATKTNEFISKYAEGMIAFQWNKHSIYMSILISSKILWVMLIISNNDNPSEKREKHIHPRFRRVRVIQWVGGHNVLICSCGYSHLIGLPCGHLFHVKGNIYLTDCDIRWYKSYNYHSGSIPWYIQQVSQIINRVKVVGIPFAASPPTIVSVVYTNYTDSFFLIG